MAILQGRRVGGSGGGKFLKGDGHDAGNFVYFVKATDTVRTTAARAIRKLWNEAVAGARGPAGHGDGSKPALIFDLEGELFLLCRLEDHAGTGDSQVGTVHRAHEGAGAAHQAPPQALRALSCFDRREDEGYHPVHGQEEALKTRRKAQAAERHLYQASNRGKLRKSARAKKGKKIPVKKLRR